MIFLKRDYIYIYIRCRIMVRVIDRIYLAYTVERVNDNLDVLVSRWKKKKNLDDLTFVERRSIGNMRNREKRVIDRYVVSFFFLLSCSLFVYTFVFVVAARQRDARKELVSRRG